jgi:ssDNA-binding Zn-finger/Zn-ribbon topoisomerase 1
MAVLECPECHVPLTDIRPWLTGNYLGDPCERGTCPKCLQVWLQNPATGAMKLVRLESRCPVCDSPFVTRQRIGTITVSACQNHPQYSSVGDCSNAATPEP